MRVEGSLCCECRSLQDVLKLEATGVNNSGMQHCRFDQLVCVCVHAHSSLSLPSPPLPPPLAPLLFVQFIVGNSPGTSSFVQYFPSSRHSFECRTEPAIKAKTHRCDAQKKISDVLWV